MEFKGLLPHQQKPATCPCPEPDRSSPSPHPISWRFILILFCHLLLGLPSSVLHSGSPSKPLYASLLSFIRAKCSVQIILLDLVTRMIFVRSTEHKAPFCVVFSTSLLPRPSWAKISSSALYSRKPSSYIPPSMWVTNFHNHTKQQARL